MNILPEPGIRLDLLAARPARLCICLSVHHSCLIPEDAGAAAN